MADEYFRDLSDDEIDAVGDDGGEKPLGYWTTGCLVAELRRRRAADLSEDDRWGLRLARRLVDAHVPAHSEARTARQEALAVLDKLLGVEAMTATLGLAMKSREAAEALARSVRGKRRHDEGHVSYECPAPAVMTARIEPSSPETAEAGYPFTLVIGCRVPEDP